MYDLTAVDDLLRRLDKEVSQTVLAAKVERLAQSAATAHFCAYWDCECRQLEHYIDKDDLPFQAYGMEAVEYHSDMSVDEEFHAWCNDEQELWCEYCKQNKLYNYDVIEGRMKDCFGNDIWRGDKVVYATNTYKSARLTVAEYIEQVDDKRVRVQPLQRSWSQPREKERTYVIGTENLMLLESAVAA